MNPASTILLTKHNARIVAIAWTIPENERIAGDACAIEDFSDNSNYIIVGAPSILGPDGDYSVAVETGSEQACKTYCDESDLLA